MAENSVIKRTGFEQFREDFAAAWNALPFKTLFFVLLGVWFAIFQFLGNSTLGYKNTPSLFGWLDYVLAQKPDDQHGPWMLVAILVLLWWKRRELLDVPKQNWWPALGLLVFAVLLHALGYMVQQTRISIVGFFVGVYALIGVVWGFRAMRATFFPILLFSFCFPMSGTVGDSATLPLRIVATKITTLVCRGILGINVVQSGTQLFDSNHTYSYDVAAACSGIRSLTATLALAVIYGFVVFRSPWRRLAMIAATIPLAIVANVLRLTSIVVVSELFGSAAGGYVHESTVLSLIPYVPLIGGILLCGYWLRRGTSEAPLGSFGDSWSNRELAMIAGALVGFFALREVIPSLKYWTWQHQYSSMLIGIAVVALAVIAWARVADRRVEPGLMPRWSAAVAALTVLLMAGSAAGLHYRHQHQKLGEPGVKVVQAPVYDTDGKIAATNTVPLPENPSGFSSQPMPMSRVVLDWLPKDTTYSQRLYRSDDGFESQVNVVLMGTDRTSIHQPQYCLTGQGWGIVQSELDNVSIREPHLYQLPVNKLTVSRDGIVGIYVYWFVAENRLTANHGQRMWDMGLEMLRTGVLQRWAYVSSFSICRPGQEEATYNRMKQLIAVTVPEFQLATRSGTTLARNP